MRYIWINPVVDRMYDRSCLHLLLQKHGYLRVECRENWGQRVLKEYKRLAESSQVPVADVRCPKVWKLLEERYKGNGILIPAIEPILMHCARVIAGREELKGKAKVITTPCEILADIGNKAKLPETRFVSWKQFLLELGERLESEKLESSPIPPGFFQNLQCLVVSITGEDEVCSYLKNGDYGAARMIELLWCRDGCHHGDGVIDLE